MSTVDLEVRETASVASPVSLLPTRLVLIAGTLALCVAMLETGLRVSGKYGVNSVEGFFAQGRTCYCLKRNFSQKIHWPASTFTVTTDDMGFRFSRTGVRVLPDRSYSVVLGASDAFGLGLDYDKTFVGVFGERLERDGIQLINMAVAGHSLDLQEDLLKNYLSTAKASPLQVFICLNPHLISEFDDRHENTIVRKGYLFGRQGWRLAFLKNVLQNKSTVYCFLRDGVRNIQLRYLGSKDFDVEYYFGTYSKEARIRNDGRSRDFLKRLKSLEEYIRSFNATPVCVYCPTVGGFAINKLNREGKLDGTKFDTGFFPKLVAAHCANEGLQFINLEPVLQSLFDQGNKLNIELDGHFNGPTSRVLGGFLYNSVADEVKQLKTASSKST